jgi:hypothetical protein
VSGTSPAPSYGSGDAAESVAPAGAPAPSGGLASDLPKARAPQPDDLVVSPEAACDLVSEHGGEIVIMDDGRVVFMNASEHLVEIAAALDPENPDIQKRLEAIERARAQRGG